MIIKIKLINNRHIEIYLLNCEQSKFISNETWQAVR